METVILRLVIVEGGEKRVWRVDCGFNKINSFIFRIGILFSEFLNLLMNILYCFIVECFVSFIWGEELLDRLVRDDLSVEGRVEFEEIAVDFMENVGRLGQGFDLILD